MEQEKTQKKQNPCIPPNYTYYVLCRRCHSVNVPAEKGLCSSCAKKSDNIPHDNYRPRPDANKQVKRDACKCGALPWRYRGKREDKEMCHLEYSGYFISVQRQPDRRFCYIVGNKKETVFRKNITELVFARNRAVRHLAKILGITFNELCEKIKKGE
jgi:hypothetical protein